MKVELRQNAFALGAVALAVSVSGCAIFDDGTYNNRQRAAEYYPETVKPAAKAPQADTGNAADAKNAMKAAVADVSRAKKLSPKWNGADAMLKEAQASMSIGQYAAAEDLAKHVSAQAEGVENTYFVRNARQSFRQAAEFSRMTEDQYQRLRLAELSILRSEGRRAATLLKGLLAEMRAAKMMYTVVSGDTLWRISGKAEVYGNPLLWPLIYKSNHKIIPTPESLKIGQELTVRTNPLLDEVRGAVDFARERRKLRGTDRIRADKAYIGSVTK